MANLTETILYEADLSLALNKDLSGAVLTTAIITWSDLVGIDFSGKDLSATIFNFSNLTNQDFTNNVTFDFPSMWIGSNLSNSNFEGVDLSPTNAYTDVVEGLGHLENIWNYCSSVGIQQLISIDCLTARGPNNPMLIISTQVRGNDLAVSHVYYADFALANLENANFKNAGLHHANFHEANLANADFSGADLSGAFLLNANLAFANLSDANLDGAILDGAILDGANLKCINHQICLNE